MTARIAHPRPRLSPGPIAKRKGAKSGLTPLAREILDRVRARRNLEMFDALLNPPDEKAQAEP